jgi:hypothetical protein
MTREVTCPGCSHTFEIPEDLRGAWLECPHCGGAVVNLGALSLIVGGWRAGVGVLLALLATLGFAIALMDILLAVAYCLDAYAPVYGRSKLLGIALACFSAVPCAVLFLSGLLFFRADLQAAGKGARTTGAIAALLAAALLEALFKFLVHHLVRY